MKKKIGEIYNIPVVIGNKNEVTKNEVHIDELFVVGDSSEDSLSKVERAFILDFDKRQEWEPVYLELTSFPSSIVISDLAENNNYACFENIRRCYGSIGFTVSSLTCDKDESFNTIKQYMIEVPVEDFYGLSNNNRVYFCRRDLSRDQYVEYVTKIIDEKFPNLKEGEEVVPKGYIIPVFTAIDDWGYITNIKKINNKYMVNGIRNGQPTGQLYLDQL